MDVNDAIEQTIATTTHGRYLMAPPSTSRGAPVLVGFHGYGEGAESQLERLTATPAALDWLVVSIQGLHRFYDRRTNQVVASWMTRQNRELAMTDNRAYVSAVLEDLWRGWPFPFLVFAGFSQGVAMAFRAAAASTRRVAGVIAVGGDIPPEIEAPALANVGSVLHLPGRARRVVFAGEVPGRSATAPRGERARPAARIRRGP